MLAPQTLSNLPSGEQLRAAVRDGTDVLRALCRTGDALARQRLSLVRSASKAGDLRAAFAHLVGTPRLDA